VFCTGIALAVAIVHRYPDESTDPEADVIQADAIDDGAIAQTNERIRSARLHWAALAGANADPRDIDAVLRCRDPQYDVSGGAQTSPTITTADALHRRAAARWRVAWAVLGVDEPPA